MRLYFIGNGIFTNLKVSSTKSSWHKEYSQVIIDTGAFNTAIPIYDINPPNTEPQISNLKFSHVHRSYGVGFSGILSVYEANLLIGEEDEYQNVHVVGIPMGRAVIGREIISLFKWEIDWKTRIVKITKNK